MINETIKENVLINFDMDINEALEVPRNFDDELYTISKIISN